MHLCINATITVHICMVTVSHVFNILHFFSLLHLTLLVSHSHLSLVLSVPQSTDSITDQSSVAINEQIAASLALSEIRET